MKHESWRPKISKSKIQTSAFAGATARQAKESSRIEVQGMGWAKAESGKAGKRKRGVLTAKYAKMQRGTESSKSKDQCSRKIQRSKFKAASGRGLI
jgi:hypothetical protein